MNKPFFTKDLFGNDIIDNNKKPIDLCEKCKLYKTCISPKMKYTGQGLEKILIIGEAPGLIEDEKNIQLIGKSGQLLRKILRKYNIDLDRDCWKTNAIICRPQNNKTPTTAQINYCRQNLLKTINELKPEKIITLGKVALDSLIGNKISINSINKWIGWQIPDQNYKCWIFPTYHPAYILRNQDNIVLGKTLENNLKKAIEWKKEFETIDLDNIINIITDEQKVIDYLDTLEKEVIAFDFETTGLKPYKEGHKIVCMSISNGKKHISFPIFKSDRFKGKLQLLFDNDFIKKISHNLNFENLWCENIFDIDIKNWYWDTMIASHILDNRAGITGLKFQTYINFGIIGYDNEVKKYLESNTDFNNIEKCDTNKLLLYCGLDSFFAFKLYELQKDKMSNFLKQGLDLFLQGAVELSNIQMNGIRFDIEQYEKSNVLLLEKMNLLENKIQNSKEVERLNLERKWFEGLSKGNKFNFNSTKELRYLFYDVLKWKTDKSTPTGMNSCDKEALESFDKPFTNNILEYRYLKKIKDTYLSQFGKEAVKTENDYFLHPNFNLHTVRTFRSSSNSPNFQNIPVRDEYAKNIVRGCLIPRKDHKIMEVDYSGIEVRISCLYHQDPVMIDYVNDPTKDMHKDQAELIFQINNNDKRFKEYKLRYLAKNKFVFPQFYGDYYKNCAYNIWNALTKEQRESLNLKNYNKFENYIADIEYDFWFNRFKVYRKWKETSWNRYLKTGFIRLKTGFICRGEMKKNDVLNYPIQGTAFHVLLWSLININRYLKKNGMSSCIVGQIHDSLILDVDPKEENKLRYVLQDFMCCKVREHWSWINVPLEIEIESTDKNQSWNFKKGEKYNGFSKQV